MSEPGEKREEREERCFGCGADNPRGLKLRFERVSPDTVECRFRADADLCGRAGVVHGGVQATLLDEAMGHAAHLAFDAGEEVSLATLELALRYRRPAPAELPLLVRARVEGREGRDVRLSGEIVGAGGETLTEARSRWRRL